tara:strand:- start:2203 stop:2373 length:171 start_codon:yes stop_codon:yes gene_type:complete
MRDARDNQIQDLYVLINTMQTNMQTLYSYLPEEKKKEVETPSYKWCMNWKPGDESK